MKKILALVLTVLMLLPVFSSIVFAINIPEGTDIANVAGNASLSIGDPNGMSPSIGSSVKLDRLVDGDKSTGSNSPQALMYSYLLDYEQVYYFTKIVVACNGSGKLYNNVPVKNDTYNVYELIVRVFDGDKCTYQSSKMDVRNLKELVVEPNAKGDRVEIYKVGGSGDRNEYMWEIETYAPDMELCDAKLTNVASEAVFSATGANNNNFWAIRYNALTDGDPLTGTHSPQGRNYSIWMTFPKEFLLANLDIVCNTDGGAVLLAENNKINDRCYNNSMLRVRVYNYNEDIVWDSDLVDVSTITTLELTPYSDCSIIEIMVYNGNYGGGEYFYEVSAYAQSGEHVFLGGAEENPTCMLPGYREMNCHCGLSMKESIPATGFHKWDEGTLTKGASDTENGVMTIACTGCDMVKLRDVPAVGHNWDNGKTVAAKCGADGYTEYKCTGCAIENCTASYKANYTDGYAHIWDDGKVTTKPEIGKKGETTYTCINPGCGETYTTPIRAHKFTDNTTSLTMDNITSMKNYISKDWEVNSGSGMDTMGNKEPIDPKKVFDGKTDTYWYAPPGSYIEIMLDDIYYFIGGTFYVSSNYTFMKIDFTYPNPNFNHGAPESESNQRWLVSKSYNPGAIQHFQPDNPMKYDMAASLADGFKASRITITTIDGKWQNGYASKVHEVSFKMHDCVITEDDYILDANKGYVAPKCGVDGQCKAECQVCGRISTVTLPAGPDAGHRYSSVIADTKPTCVGTGIGHAECLDCKQLINGITIPATGEHDYSVEKELISAKCGFAGVLQIHCSGCDKVGQKIELAPTGKHEYEWSTKSQANYTADGITEYSCIYCDELDASTEENTIIAEKTPIPSDIVSFVKASKDNGALTLTYKIKLEYFEEIQYTCDIRVLTVITDAEGREATIESYGKYATNSYNETTGEFSVTIYPKDENAKFEFATAIRLMNFRGVVYKAISNGSYSGAISMNDVQ